MLAPAENTTEVIARLNDRTRHGLDRTARITITSALLAYLSEGSGPDTIMAQSAALKAVRSCTFSKDNPERDMAFIEINGVRAYFRIDYYGSTLTYGSEDPANAAITCRVLTIMAPEDM